VSRDLARYARSGAWSLIAYAFQIVGAIVVSIAVVRALDTEQIGVLGLARQFTATVVVLSGLALERTFLRFGPELVQRAGGGPAVRLLLKAVVIRLVAWLPFPLIAWVAQDPLSTWFGDGVGAATWIGVLTGVSYSLYAQLRAAATARFATAAVAFSSIVTAVTTLSATLWVLHRGPTVEGVLIAAGLGLLVGCLPLVSPAFDRSRRGELEAGDDAGDAFDLRMRDRRFVDYAWPFACIAVLNHAVHSQTEVFFLGYWHGPELAGFFHHGFTFAQRLVDFLPLALWEVSMAGFSRLVTRNPEELGRAVRGYLVLLYMVLMPLALLGVAFSPIATLLLYGEKMMPAAMVAQAYFGMAMIAAAGAPFGMVLYAKERTRAVLWIYVAIALVNVVLDLLLIPSFALGGAVIGLAAAKIVSVLLMLRLVRRELGHVEWPRRFLVRSLGASSVALIGWPLSTISPTWFGAVAAFVVCVFSLVVAFRVFRVVGPDEAALVRGTDLPLAGWALRVVGVRSEVPA